jgi:hypothetical protein
MRAGITSDMAGAMARAGSVVVVPADPDPGNRPAARRLGRPRPLTALAPRTHTVSAVAARTTSSDAGNPMA